MKKLLVMAFLALNADAARVITTGMGLGADTYLSNDSDALPIGAWGLEPQMELREFAGARMRHLYIRFDISSLAGQDLSGATITLTGTFINRNRPLDFYGVMDGASSGQGEFWDENTITFDTAAGIDPITPLAAQPMFTADATPFFIATTSTLPIVAAPLPEIPAEITTIPSPDLDAFIAADTNGIITFIVTLEQANNGSELFIFSTKEGGSPPSITFPNAIPEPSGLALVGIGGVGLALRRRRR